MIKLNETSSTNINVLGEDELTQVVGGYCHRRRRGGYGRRHCGGGWRKRDWDNYGGGYEGGSDDYEGGSDDYENEYEPKDDYSSNGNVQVANVDVTINIAQVQG